MKLGEMKSRFRSISLMLTLLAYGWLPAASGRADPRNLTTWTFSPAVIGTSKHISSIVTLERPIRRLSDIRLVTSCGCVVASVALVPYDPLRVRINFIYRPHPPEAEANETLEVVSSLNSSDVLGQLNINASVRYPLSVDPEVIDLGSLLAGRRTSPTIVTVKAYSNLPAPKGVSSSPSWLVVKRQQWTSAAASFNVWVSQNAPPGPLEGTIIFQSGLLENQPSVKVTGYAEGDFVAVPQDVQFPIDTAARNISVIVRLSPHSSVKYLPRLQAHSNSRLVTTQIRSWSRSSGCIDFELKTKFARSGVNTGQVELTDTSDKIVLIIPYRFIWLN